MVVATEMVGHWGRIHGLTSWICPGISIAFAALAFSMGAVSLSGAAAGALVCFLLCAGGGFSALAALITVFALAWLSTKIGYQRKQRIGTAEKIEGRNAYQVLANLGVAALCAILYALQGRAIFLLGIAASLSEAAADTVSSEIGQLSSEKARLITTWKLVPAGTDGGVTVLGTASGLAAAIAVSAACIVGGMVPWNRAGIVILAAFFGTVADSFLGAALERRGLLNNDLVNFLGTLVAALIALAVWL
jgi:uncharacterized protein (TIGR00297 family)